MQIKILLLTVILTGSSIAFAQKRAEPAMSSFKELSGIEYKILYPTYLPTNFKFHTVKKYKGPDYIDYTIKVCGAEMNCCEVNSGHELGDPLLFVDKNTKWEFVNTKTIPKTKIFYATNSEYKKWLDEYTSDGKSSKFYGKNAISTDWFSIEKKAKVSYLFSCFGVEQKEAKKIFKSLAVLK